MKNFIALLAGFIFAIGLAYSGMTQPHIVKGFLDILGNWNPQLIGVMIGAIAIHAIFYRVINKMPSPLLDSHFHLPTKKNVDTRLIIGAVIFGLGWGWAGICPGPGVTALASGEPLFLYFLGSLLLGMKTFQISEKKLFKNSKHEAKLAKPKDYISSAP